MVHAVSATFKRFEHMSPPAAGMALVMHALVAILLWWSAPVHALKETPSDAITVTMEAPPPPPPEPKPAPQPPKPPPPKAAPPAINMRGLPPPAPAAEKAQGSNVPRGLPPEAPPSEKAEQAPTKSEEPPQQAAAAAPQAKPPEPKPPEPKPPEPKPPAPTLEQELPPVEAPPAPVTSREVPRLTPPTPGPQPQPTPPRPPQHVQPPRPAPPQSGLQPSPLSRLQRGAPPPSTRPDGQPSTVFVNPADVAARNTVAEAYLQQVNYRISLQIFAPSSPEELRLIVGVRFTIARNGRLIDASIARSSGNTAHDTKIINAFRAASPFPPLPPELSGDSTTFTMPIGTRVAR